MKVMTFAVGADHGGFPLKLTVIETLEAMGHMVLDLGTHSTESVDYPDFAAAVGRAVASKQAERGIILCGSGVGACVAANKLHGVRACVCHDTYSAAQGVEHDDMNVLCLGARIIGPALVVELVQAFANADFQHDPRFVRRLDKVLALEAQGV